jgi:hypothetical protein
MPHPTSLRLDVSTRRRLQDRAEQEQVPAATVALRLIDEGLRMAAHPGVVFRAGPAGRRPALGSGPDVAEVVSVIHHLAETGDEAEAEAARWLELPQPAVRSAVNYYVEFTDEIDREIERREEAATAAHQHWTRRQQLLS